jgi:hypothetical protein
MVDTDCRQLLLQVHPAERVATATRITIDIIRAHPGQISFAVHKRRRVVERLFTRLSRNPRLAKDFEATIASAEAVLYAVSVLLLTGRLAHSQRASSPTIAFVEWLLPARQVAFMHHAETIDQTRREAPTS